MYVIELKMKSGQLETTGGYEIIDFKVNSSSINITTIGNKSKNLHFTDSKSVQIYASDPNNPILVRGGR